MQRINTAKAYFDQYKNMPGFDVKLYDTRMKDVNRALKRAQKAQKSEKTEKTEKKAPPPAPAGGNKTP